MVRGPPCPHRRALRTATDLTDRPGPASRSDRTRPTSLSNKHANGSVTTIRCPDPIRALRAATWRPVIFRCRCAPASRWPSISRERCRRPSSSCSPRSSWPYPSRSCSASLAPRAAVAPVCCAAPPWCLQPHRRSCSGSSGSCSSDKNLGWLPASGRTAIADAPTGPTGLLTIDSLLAARFDVFADALRHLLLPAICLAIVPAVAVGRVLRGAILTNLRADHVQVARAKGLSEIGVLVRHCLRNSAGPTLAMAGLMTGVVFAGVAVVETIFAWPGIGLYINQSIPRGRLPCDRRDHAPARIGLRRRQRDRGRPAGGRGSAHHCLTPGERILMSNALLKLDRAAQAEVEELLARLVASGRSTRGSVPARRAKAKWRISSAAGCASSTAWRSPSRKSSRAVERPRARPRHLGRRAPRLQRPHRHGRLRSMAGSCADANP